MCVEEVRVDGWDGGEEGDFGWRRGLGWEVGGSEVGLD